MNWQAVTDAFEKARSLPGAERPAFLKAHCAGDDELRREVESLLRAFEESDDFLGKPALASASTEVFHAVSEPFIGSRLGPYKITRKIGEGGMGAVFEAERADGEFRQRVAIKIVREDWPDPQWRSRFRSERQILSDLSHPNIARLLDGGTIESGAPYLVMELIEGRPLDVYCEAHQLTLAQRVDLFQKVAAAVDYANTNHVIHCDIKPGNILVTADGTPKLLDFGIARLRGANPQTTMAHLRVATPDFASPEQIGGLALNSATDIYSLGAVLRKLTACQPKVPPALRQTIAKAMQPNPEDRFRSAAELGEAARAAVESQSQWSRRAWLGGIAGAGAASLAGGYLWLRRTTPVLAGNEALAVMRIDNRTGDRALDWIDRGIADMLATNFAQTGSLEVISTSRSRELLERSANDQRKAAEAAHAAYYVTGDLLRMGAGYRLNLRVEHTPSGRIEYAERFDGSDAGAIISLVDQSSAAILAHLRLAAVPAPSAGQALSSNLEALRLYEQGFDALERWQIPDARSALNRAVEIDPRFAMAYFALALTKPWNPPEALADLDRARDLASRLRLPVRERNMIDATRLMTAGQVSDSIRVLREVIRQNPRDIQARMALVSALIDDGDVESALRIGSDARSIDPNSRYVIFQSSLTFALAGRFPEALDYADRYTATLKAGDWNGLDQRGDVLSLAERFDEAAATYAKVNRNSKVALALMHSGNFDRAEDVLKTNIGRGRNPISNGGWLGFLGDIQVGRGDLASARTWFEQGVRAYTPYDWYGGMILWKASQGYLEQSQPVKVLELADTFASHPWSHGPRTVALQMMGKSADADVSLSKLGNSVGKLLGNYMGSRYEELYRLFGMFYRGEHAKVVALAERLPRTLWNFYALAAGRSNLALGNLEAAERHLNFSRRNQLSFGMVGLYEAHNMLAFLLGEFYLGQVAARRGQSAQARAKIEFFLKHFENSTARLPQIAEARSIVSRHGPG